VGNFSEGLAVVVIGGKYGYIDESGSIVVEPKFDQAFNFDNGLATVQIADRYGYIDTQGNYIWNPTN
jgi:hypothetical protein